MSATTSDGDGKNATKQDEVKSQKDPTTSDPEVKDGEPSAKQPAKPKRGLGLFRGAAISVLSKVIETKEDEYDSAQSKQREIAKDCMKDSRSMSLEDPEASNKTREGILNSVKSRRRSTDLGTLDQVIQNARRRKSSTDPDEIGRRPSISSIVGIVTLRKMYMSKNQHARKDSQPNLKPKLDLSEIKPEDMPEAPRFGATLSQEAQYATLSCYGDKVLNYLKTAGHSAWRRTSDRTQTPPNTDTLLLADQDDHNKGANLPAIDNTIGRQKTVTSRNSHDVTNKQPKSKDLKVTHRLEYVMDILDKVKSAEGGITTTPRLRLKDMDPVQHAESWLLSWDTEFTTKDKEAEE